MRATLPRLPKSPLNPTMQDCRGLAQDFYEMTRKLHEQNSACLRGDARIGQGQECSLVSRKVVNVLRAWPQCSSIEVELCEVYARADAERSTCRARAANRADKEGRNETQRTDALKKANDKYEEIVASYHEVSDYVSDPRGYLVTKANQAIWSRIFPDGMRESAQDRPDLAQEVYRYTFNQSRAGLAMTPNPVIQAFQKTNLDFLQVAGEQTMAHMASITAEMGRFTVGNAALVKRDMLPVPAPKAASECDVMKDTEASARLFDSDFDRWTALVQKCGG